MHEIIETRSEPIKAWIARVTVEAEARAQLRRSLAANANRWLLRVDLTW